MWKRTKHSISISYLTVVAIELTYEKIQIRSINTVDNHFFSSWLSSFVRLFFHGTRKYICWHFFQFKQICTKTKHYRFPPKKSIPYTVAVYENVWKCLWCDMWEFMISFWKNCYSQFTRVCVLLKNVSLTRISKRMYNIWLLHVSV